LAAEGAPDATSITDEEKSRDAIARAAEAIAEEFGKASDFGVVRGGGIEAALTG
jgi:hypothetical protein